jgi:hypothetical protein
MAKKHLSNAAMPLITVCLRTIKASPNPAEGGGAGVLSYGATKILLANELRRFHGQALQICNNIDVANDASYLLCTLVDELLTSRFGMDWMRNGLLVEFHNESHGGEKSWELLKTLLSTGHNKLDSNQLEILKLYETAIVFGLRGKYRMRDDGEKIIQKYRSYIRTVLSSSETRNIFESEMLNNALGNVYRQRSGYFIVFVAGWIVTILATVAYVDHQIQKQWNVIDDDLSKQLKLRTDRPLSVANSSRREVHQAPKEH